MEKSFLNREQAMLTVMVQAGDPDRVKELMNLSTPLGAEGFGVQLERMKPEYKKQEIYKELIDHTDLPVYVTNYRTYENEGRTDEDLAEELLKIADHGKILCDVMGDYFDPQPGELTVDPAAVEKQKQLIAQLHKKGAEVLMSSHVFTYTPAERVLEIALAHQERGADIAKIVTGAETMEQQLENLKIIQLLKEKLNIPFLFLCVGECGLLRRIGGQLGCCMYLCVYEHDDYATPAQPLLTDVKVLRELL